MQVHVHVDVHCMLGGVQCTCVCGALVQFGYCHHSIDDIRPHSVIKL